jgi:hypothetical protein
VSQLAAASALKAVVFGVKVEPGQEGMHWGGHCRKMKRRRQIGLARGKQGVALSRWPTKMWKVCSRKENDGVGHVGQERASRLGWCGK